MSKKELLDEADRLLRIAYTASIRLGLQDRGSDCSLPHELRMFALNFSREARTGPGDLQTTGSGAYLEWRRKLQDL